MSKSYLNFDLLLNEAGDSYRVYVIDSPAGQASNTFTLPFSILELENLVLKIGQNRGNVRSLHIDTIDMPSIKKWGSALYEALFSGSVAERFRSSLAIARHEGKGLRIRLRLSGAPKLIDIPWELLFDATNNNYIGLSVNTPIIRKLDLATQPEMHQVQNSLQVLVMISSPSNYPQLNVEQEWERVNTATKNLQKEGRLVLTRVEPSLAALQRQLRCAEYHVFHYIGHGGFDRTNNDGLLVLEDQYKKGYLVSGQYLGTILCDETSLQLVLLNSCNGGRTSVTDPFAGVGQSLLQRGIPAIIAMQFEISDEAAITFSHEFYAALADGYPIDAAVAEARKMIYAQANQLEWATPVLYTSIDGGTLLRSTMMKKKPEVITALPGKQAEKLVSLPIGRPEAPPLSKSSNRFSPKIIGLISLLLVSGLTVALFKHLNTVVANEDKSTEKTTIAQGQNTEVNPTIEANATFTEPEMVFIHAGSFTMGCKDKRDNVDTICPGVEKPAHEVSINAFRISKYEVTFDEWDSCEKTGPCPHADDHGWGRGKRPVINVSWNNITKKYIPWLNQKTGKAYRLPTEAEWEYAARGGYNTAYPWGDNYGINNANCAECGSQWDNKKTAPIGSFAANGYGLYDTSGNVWEWVADCWSDNYQDAEPSGAVKVSCNTGNRFVVRGGSWRQNTRYVRSATRYRYGSSENYIDLGFRLAIDH